jgi:hypothetical protein
MVASLESICEKHYRSARRVACSIEMTIMIRVTLSMVLLIALTSPAFAILRPRYPAKPFPPHRRPSAAADNGGFPTAFKN